MMITMPRLVTRNYPEMLRKISASTFLVSIFAIYLLRENIPQIENVLKVVDISAPDVFNNNKIHLGTLILAFCIAATFEMFKLHDRISDLLNIRGQFDVCHILQPLALMCGAKLSHEQYGKLVTRRDDLMSNCYYKYASSSEGKSAIDPHNITLALTQWSWIWCFLEAIIIIFISLCFTLYFGKFELSVYLLIGALLFMLVIRLLKRGSVRYAERQVTEIVSNSARVNAIRGIFNAI